MVIKKLNLTFYIALASIGIFLAAFQRTETEISTDLTGGASFVAALTALLYTGIFLSSVVMGELSMRIGKKKITVAGVISIMLGQLVLGCQGVLYSGRNKNHSPVPFIIVIF